MNCSKCAKEIHTLADYGHGKLCRRCYNEYMLEYQRAHYGVNREKICRSRCAGHVAKYIRRGTAVPGGYVPSATY